MDLGDFTAQASAYGRARPAYPDELVDELLHLAESAEGDAVCDLGAGTGILARQLAQRALRVTALEPNPRMREQAPQDPRITWREGTFEFSGLPDDAFDLALAAQSFHWADLPHALAEVHRILRAGARFGVLWNDRGDDRHPILSHTHRLVCERVPGFSELYRGRDWGPLLVSTGHFTAPTKREQSHIVPMSCARFLDLWRSHNMLNHLAGPEQITEILVEIERRLVDERWREIRVPYVCRAWLVRRA